MTTNAWYQNQAFWSTPSAFEPVEVLQDLVRGETRRIPRGVEYKENGDVEFNLIYRKGTEVRSAEVLLRSQANGGKEQIVPMELVEKDLWWAVVSGLEPGAHVFRLRVNGVVCLHPDAPLYYNGDQYTNYFDLPEPGFDTYTLKKVPHGSVRTEYYDSSIMGKTRSCTVYTPANYDSSDRDYPTLYLQHGGGENETGWFYVGKANFILDNLIAAGKCKEMVVVCNNGFVFDRTERPSIMSHMENLSQLLLEDCIPFIEKRFRVKKGKSNRAMAGLSMGSFQTMVAAYCHPEIADYYGLMSGANLSTSRLFDPEVCYKDINAFNNSHKLLFISQGLDEGGATLQERMQPYLDRGIRAELFTCKGAHEFQTWRKALCQFLPRLFADEAP